MTIIALAVKQLIASIWLRANRPTEHFLSTGALMRYALHTTSGAALQRAAQLQADIAHAAHLDAREALEGVSWASLTELREQARDASDWLTVNELDSELTNRRTETLGGLMAAFRTAVDTNGTLPWLEGSMIASMPVRDWLAEEAGCSARSEADMVDMWLDPAARERQLAELAMDYAKGCVDELLEAGWTA